MTTSTGALARTALDGPIEQLLGPLLDLHHDHKTGLLDPERAALAAAHRDLATAESALTYHRNVLMRLASGTLPVDTALLDRIRRTVNDLTHATSLRDTQQARTTTALERVQATAAPRVPAATELSAHDYAALLALAAGGTVREHLLTHRVSVRTTQGRTVDLPAFQRLEQHGLVARDTSRDLTVGQPVILTGTGRTALLGSNRKAPTPAAAAPARPAGAWPTAAPASRSH
ncbi:hypothetical protein ACFH04_13515 [Streptomyces noboritoensis]|uniref:DUF222 domain-containing protein n=1 Tax=Streptomyces noboritoensis TaxID=67337 RepID=A0ABV6TG09_9ACTN